MNTLPTGAALVAGVVGQPIRQSLSPFLHTAWLRHMGLNGVYAPFSPVDEHAFERLILSCRTNGIKGLNVTAPFKEIALKLADSSTELARRSGSANLLTFDDEGGVHANSTDGHGLIQAFRLQAPACDLTSGAVTLLGAGGASRAVVASLLDLGCRDVRIVNRTVARAEEIVFAFGEGVTAYALSDVDRAFEGSVAVINAASGGPLPPLDALDEAVTVMDMTYRPLMTGFLQSAAARRLTTVDGLMMLIEQARPSFEAFYGVRPDPDCDVRRLALDFLGEA
ncbi:MAG: shikimate dehydrogenase [Asticcacaulis sp.]